MGRPTVADERRRQIVAAAIRCLSQVGLAGTTLDRIGAEVGMARGHVRHFAGNRDEILIAAATMFYFDALPERDAAADAPAHGAFLPAGTTTVDQGLDYLFGEFAEPGPANLAALAFVDAARTDDRIREVTASAYLCAAAEIAALLRAAAPHRQDAEVERAAYGVVALSLGNAFLSDIRASVEHAALARRNAELLVAELCS